MKHHVKLYILFCLVILCAPGIALAQKADSQFGEWNVFTLRQKGQKICYITAAPSEKTGDYKKRGEPYFLVTKRGRKNAAEVSVSSGYEYKEGSMAQLNIDNKHRYELFTSPQTPRVAWGKSVEDDKAIITQLMKGTRVGVKGKSQRGSYSEDTYPLQGFTKAYKRMLALCK